jgi:hypothetical protein
VTVEEEDAWSKTPPMFRLFRARNDAGSQENHNSKNVADKQMLLLKQETLCHVRC